MPIILECRHRLFHTRAFLAERNRGQSTFHCVYNGPSFTSRIRHQEGKTSWPQIWETSRKQRISSGPPIEEEMQKKKFQGIHDRFLRDHVFRERMIENNRDEEVCRAWDVLAEQDHTYRMPEEEYFYYKNKWWITLTKSGNTAGPLRKRSDFKQALSTLERLHQEDGGEQFAPTSLLEEQTMEVSIEFVLHMVGMARLLVVFLRIHRKSRRRRQAKACHRSGQPVVYRTLAKTSDEWLSRIHFILLVLDRLQQTAVYCNRRGV